MGYKRFMVMGLFHHVSLCTHTHTNTLVKIKSGVNSYSGTVCEITLSQKRYKKLFVYNSGMRRHDPYTTLCRERKVHESHWVRTFK